MPRVGDVYGCLTVINEKTLTISQCAKEYNLTAGTLRSRIDRGWDIKKALTTPVKK